MFLFPFKNVFRHELFAQTIFFLFLCNKITLFELIYIYIIAKNER